MTDTDALYAGLLARLKEIAHLNAAKTALEWDMETVMPEAAAEARSETVACLAGLAHGKATSPEFEEIIAPLAALLEDGSLDPDDPCYAIVGRAWKDFRRASKLPTAFVAELEGLCAASHHVWSEARTTSDWSLFLPNFSRIVAMRREEAELVGYGASPYDALLDQYEPGMDAAKTAALLGGLAPPLARLVRRIADSPRRSDPAPARIPASRSRQEGLNRHVAEALGFDFAAGRLDPSAHPFTTRFHPGDVRITTRYDEDDLMYALMSTVHEVGHGLYEQGLPRDLYGTPAGEAPSLGIHESQSRLWENAVARSLPFCEWLLAAMRGAGFVGAPAPETFHRALNVVSPSFIRTEADEVTYNLHICLRFEIERDLIEGRLAPSDVPAAWNAKMKEYLGLEVTDDAQGALQDVHWSAGLFGYFPTYSLGNVYAAQLFDAASREITGLEEGFRHGAFAELLAWLRERVHRHGSLREAEDIVRQATGEDPDARYFLRYIERKYGEIYGL